MTTIFRPWDWPIAVKLVVAFLFIALVPLLIVGFLSQQQARQGLLAEAQRNLLNTANRTSGLVDNYLKERIIEMQQSVGVDSVIRFMDKANNDRNALGPNNADQSASYNILKSRSGTQTSSNNYLMLASKNGQVELTSNIGPGQEGQPFQGELRDLSSTRYFQEAMKGQTYLSDPLLLNFQERGVQIGMYISSPVRDGVGNAVGVLVMRFSLEPIWTLVNEDAEAAGPGSYAMLIDDTDNLGVRLADSRIASRPEAQTQYIFSIMRELPSTDRGRWVNSGRFPEQFNYANASSQGVLPNVVAHLDRPRYDRTDPFFTTSYASGNETINAQVAYSPIPAKSRWYYFVVVPENTYAAAANGISGTLLIATLLAVGLVILVALGLARLLTAPIRRITNVLSLIGMGDFEARVPIRSQDELGNLGENLNAMFDNTLHLIQSQDEKEVMQTQITRLLEEISTVAEGDLTVQAEVTADITGAIADSFNLMIEELRKIIINIQNATGQTSVFFDQMVLNFEQIDHASDQQANRILAATTAVGDINTSIQRVSETAASSTEVAQEARNNARQGGLAVTQTIAGMNRIRANVQETAKKIKRLGESSQQIGEIVKLIDDIADRTNMLALNAAIQAAMAGEQGKGFSVVSEEVRRLAERSAGATREIATLVKSIQDDTAEAVVAMEESTREVVEGSKVADDAGRALAQIESVVERLANLITNISQLTRQQASSSTDIAHSMTEVSSLTQEATALRRQSSDAVGRLARTAEDLRTSVSAFKVSEGEGESRPLAPTPILAISNEDNFDEPDFYDFQPQPTASSMQSAKSYQPPVGDGDSWSSPALKERISLNNDIDFDLNQLLNDDAIFDSLFDESHKRNKKRDNNGKRRSE